MWTQNTRFCKTRVTVVAKADSPNLVVVSLLACRIEACLGPRSFVIAQVAICVVHPLFPLFPFLVRSATLYFVHFYIPLAITFFSCYLDTVAHDNNEGNSENRMVVGNFNSLHFLCLLTPIVRRHVLAFRLLFVRKRPISYSLLFLSLLSCYSNPYLY